MRYIAVNRETVQSGMVGHEILYFLVGFDLIGFSFELQQPVDL